MFGRKRKPGDFTSEIEAHLQLEIERLREQGLSEEEARASARRSFGNVTQVSGLHRHRCLDHCLGHRSHDRDFQRRRCHAVAPPAVPTTGAARKRRG